MIADAALRLIVSEPQTLFTTGCSLPAVLPFSLCFLFFIYRICFPFFSAFLFFLPEADCRLTEASTCCETNSLEYGRKLPDRESEAIDLDSNMEANKRRK